MRKANAFRTAEREYNIFMREENAEETNWCLASDQSCFLIALVELFKPLFISCLYKENSVQDLLWTAFWSSEQSSFSLQLTLNNSTVPVALLLLFPVGIISTVHGVGERKKNLGISFKNSKLGNWYVLLICFPPYYIQ